MTVATAASDFSGGVDTDKSVEKPDSSAELAEKKNVEEENIKSETQNEAQSDHHGSGRKLAIVAAAAAVILIIMLCVVFVPHRDHDDEEYVPTALDFQTGISLVKSYDVSAIITSRLVRTTIVVDVVNALRCSSIRSISLRLPAHARISSLTTIATLDGDETDELKVCSTYGEVQRIKDARENFLETASQGLPGAYIEQQNTLLHSLQVAMPPLGSSKVELVIEELLHRRLGRVDLELPFAPNEDIDQMSFRLHLAEEGNNITSMDLQLELGGDLELAASVYNGPNSTSMIPLTGEFSIDILEAHDYDDLPKLLYGSFRPQQQPQGGTLQVEDNCFELQFLPPDLEPLTRNILFVVDVSESRTHNSTKRALKDFIKSSLVEGDAFSIQLFGRKGTEDLHRSTLVNAKEVDDAIKFIDKDWKHFAKGQTNIQEAFLQGLLRAQRDMEDENTDVTLLVLISTGWADTGETDRQRIVESIYVSNFESTARHPVKIYSTAYDTADQEMLNAIAVMNGGVSSELVKSSDLPFETQMRSFFEEEFGTVLLSDVKTVFDVGVADVTSFGETQVDFPLLADGYEVVIRGLLSPHEGNTAMTATTTAVKNSGDSAWTTASSHVVTSEPSGICFQSYAHSRIDQLLRLRDVASLVSDEMLDKVARLTKPCNIDSDENMAQCIEAEAVELALDSRVVVEGLTSMVTIDKDDCLNFEEETEICVAGTAGDGVFEGTPVDDYYGGAPYGYPDSWSGSSVQDLTWTFAFGLLMLIAFAVTM